VSNLKEFPQEIWKDISGYEGYYQVSNLGNVKSMSRIVPGPRVPIRVKERILKPIKNNQGYNQVVLSKQNRKNVLVHRLVAFAFLENPDNLPDINHLDSNPLNNKLSNLEWCTATSNQEHANLYGRGPNRMGTKCYRSKINEATVLKVLSLYTKISQVEISKMLGLHKAHVSKIIHGKCWSQLTGIKSKEKIFRNN
jgi:hypothetical protein